MPVGLLLTSRLSGLMVIGERVWKGGAYDPTPHTPGEWGSEVVVVAVMIADADWQTVAATQGISGSDRAGH